MKNLGYYNGAVGLLEELSVPMLDRACYFGDGVYDAAAARNHIIYALDAHIDRFFRSAEWLRIGVPFTKAWLADLLRELTRKVDGEELLVYWQISRGAAVRNHVFPEQTEPALWVMVQPFHLHDSAVPIALITAPDTRFLHCNIKTLNLLPGVMAAQAAAEAGCYEAILHRDGRVTECARSNVHILRDGALWTAPADNLILDGIARRQLLAACAEMGVPTREEPYTLDELMEADEVIVTSTGALCARANAVDGRPVGGRAGALIGSLQRRLTERYLEATTPQ